MHILIVTPQYPFPVNSGGRIRTWHFINALRQKHQVSLLYPDHSPQTCDKDPEKERIFQHIHSLPVNPSASVTHQRFIKRLQNFHIPWEIQAGYYPDFEKKLLNIISSHSIDCLFIRYFNNAQYIFRNRKRINIPVLIDLDDLPTIYLDRHFKSEKFSNTYDRLRKGLNVYITDRYTRNLRCISNSFVCSLKDRDYVHQKKWAKQVTVIPNTIKIDAYREVSNYSPSIHTHQTILFCGHLNYSPNVEAMTWFVKDILPLILKKLPHVRVQFVGSNAGYKTKQIPHDPAVTFHYDVPSMIPYYEQSSLTIVPIRSGGGTRVKILESLACRRPIVTTTLGAEGLNMTHKKNCLLADQAEQFADSCVELLSNFAQAEQLTKTGLQFVKEHYDNSIVEKHILKMFEEVS